MPECTDWTHPAAVQAERDRAVEARIGGRELRRYDYDSWSAAEVEQRVLGLLHDKRYALRETTLPEAAFDWPIYRAAMVARFNREEDRRITAMVQVEYPGMILFDHDEDGDDA